MKWRWLVPWARYSEYWRQARKLLDPGFRPGAMMAYRPMLQKKTRTLLTRLLASPDEWEAHIERLVIFLLRSPTCLIIRQCFSLQGELILAITYGYEVKERHDRKLDAARQLAKLTSELALPGALLVNELPLRA